LLLNLPRSKDVFNDRTEWFIAKKRIVHERFKCVSSHDSDDFCLGMDFSQAFSLATEDANKTARIFFAATFDMGRFSTA